MRSAASTGDDHLNSALLRGFGVLEQKVGSAMRRHDFRLVRNAKGVEELRGLLHGVPISLGAHYQSNKRFRQLFLVYGVSASAALRSALPILSPDHPASRHLR